MTTMHTGDSAGLVEYQKMKTHSDVENATPHRLIQLMMERALTKIALAGKYIESGDVEVKGNLIGDAINIISALQQCLNHDADKKIAGNFDALYDYMLRRLLEANLHSDPKILIEVAGLLGEIKEAWDAIEGRV